jgi:hypothetical protein
VNEFPRSLEVRLSQGDQRMASIESVGNRTAADVAEMKAALIGTVDQPGGLVAHMRACRADCDKAIGGCDTRVKSLEGWRLAIVATGVWIWRTAAASAITILVAYVFFLHGIHVK